MASLKACWLQAHLRVQALQTLVLGLLRVVGDALESVWIEALAGKLDLPGRRPARDPALRRGQLEDQP